MCLAHSYMLVDRHLVLGHLQDPSVCTSILQGFSLDVQQHYAGDLSSAV